MRIAVFDIDGTLTQSSRLDDLCFQRTAKEVLGLASIELDWSAYPHSTDDAIAAHLTRMARGRPAERREIDAFHDHFMRVLAEELEAHGPLAPTAGAAGVLAAVRSAGWVPAIATGCWRRSALAKLSAAGLSAKGMGAAFADDAWPREAIIARAVQRAMAVEGVAVAERASAAEGAGAPHVVYVGDGIWDVRACARGGYRCVGIAQGPRAAALQQEGASTVLAGFADARAFLSALENASVPQGAWDKRPTVGHS